MLITPHGADDADALRAYLGHDKIVLFGHSCGGFVAMEYALRYADRLAGLILCCTTPAMDYPDVVMANAQSRGSQEQVQLVVNALTDPFRSDEDFKKLYLSIMSLYFRRYDPRFGLAILGDARLNAAAFNYCASTWFPAFNSLGWLNQIKVPTLIIAGKEDWIMPPAQGAERIHAGIPDSKLVIFQNSGHFPFIEEQKRFNKTVGDWVAGLK